MVAAHAASGRTWWWGTLATVVAASLLLLATPRPARAGPVAAPITYEATRADAAADGERFQMRVRPGATLWDIAVEALPGVVREAGNERAVELIVGGFQQSNPGRAPHDVRLDDTFTLAVPSGTFVTAKVARAPDGRSTEYTSFQGDKLTTFRADPAVVYLAQRAAEPERLRVLLRADSRLPAQDIARRVYGSDPPDFLQVRTIREALSAAPPVVHVDTRRPHVDQFRNYRERAVSVEPTDEGLTRYRFDPGDTEVPFLVVDDAIGDGWEPGGFPRLARREFLRDGTVKQYLLTQPGDVLSSLAAPARNEWAALLGADLTWTEGQPERLAPFAPAVTELGSVLPGRVLVLVHPPKPARADVARGLACLGIPVGLALGGGLLEHWRRRPRTAA